MDVSRGPPENRRRGFVLLLVLVTLPMLALGGYAFTHLMRAEARASRAGVRTAQTRWLADGGVQHALALLTDKARMIPGEYDFGNNAAAFAGVAVPGGSRAGAFSLVAPNFDSSTDIRYGLVNECAKIPLRGKRVPITRAALMGLPDMTEDLADKLVDWLDANNEPLEQGAESEYYSGLAQPLVARNADLPTIDELLGVAGVTPALFFGEDADRDGFLGARERDGDVSWPPDNSDGTLQRGWRTYFTVHSKAANLDPDGQAKTNLNGGATAAAKVAEKFTPEIAGYYVLYKSKAEGQQLKSIGDLIDTEVQIKPTEALAALSGAGLNAPALMAKFGIPMPMPAIPGPGGGGGGPMQEDDAKASAPWKAENAGEYLETALLYFGIDAEIVQVGVVDPAWAPKPVLRCLPGIDDELAGKIADAGKNRRTALTAAWLLVDGVLDAAQFRKVEPCVSMQGQVFSMQSVGYLDDGGPIGRVEAVIDASGKIPKVVSRIDLSGVPCAISADQLRQGATNLNP